MAELKAYSETAVDNIIKDNKVVIFSKTWCPYCTQAKNLLNRHGAAYKVIELDSIKNGVAILSVLHKKTGQKTVPNIFINQQHIGGYSDLHSLQECGILEEVLKHGKVDYTYDLVVIGGGSGGIAAAKEAVKFGKKVAICDFVKPSPQGSTWGFGGTCVNVGCIPKKLMHRASLIHHDLEDAPLFGWKDTTCGEHDWPTLVENVTNYIKSLNFQYRKNFKTLGIPIYNAYAEFTDKHNIKVTNKKGEEEILNSCNFIIATGLRPNYPNIPGAKEYCISSDDLFMLPQNPGKTLIVGASYIALECAGFLSGFGIACTVMVRSILLRGFDQEIASKIEENMTTLGVNFVKKCVPTSITKKNDDTLIVDAIFESGGTFTEVYDTVMFATGREALTDSLRLHKISLDVNPRNRKIIVDSKERTSVPNIFALGDIADLNIELTPVAIQAGKLLVQRLYGNKSVLTDYTNVPTTVFTPLEYGSVGLSEEKAMEQFDSELEVFHNLYSPLESQLSHRFDSKCFAKLICQTLPDKTLKVVGIHILGPNAGEIIQGFALALKMGATKEQFDNLIGIHPTCAEVFTTMNITKSSGEKLQLEGC